MEIRIKVPDKIAAQARARGVRVETYVEELLTQQARADAGEALRHRTKEEIRAWLESLAQFTEEIPPLPETITREWIYQDHN